MQSFKKKTVSWFQKRPEKFAEFSPNHSKVQKFLLNGLFLSEVYGVGAKKMYRGLIFHDTEQWYKLFINSHGLINDEELGELSLEQSKFEKLFIHGLFFVKRMFQPKNFRGFMWHDTERWSKIGRKTDLWLEKWHGDFG